MMTSADCVEIVFQSLYKEKELKWSLLDSLSQQSGNTKAAKGHRHVKKKRTEQKENFDNLQKVPFE